MKTNKEASVTQSLLKAGNTATCHSCYSYPCKYILCLSKSKSNLQSNLNPKCSSICSLIPHSSFSNIEHIFRPGTDLASYDLKSVDLLPICVQSDSLN